MNELYGVAIIPLIIGLVELLKKIGLNEKYCPVGAVFFGIIMGILQYIGEPVKGVIVGIAYGLSAVGLYSGVKNTIG